MALPAPVTWSSPVKEEASKDGTLDGVGAAEADGVATEVTALVPDGVTGGAVNGDRARMREERGAGAVAGGGVFSGGTRVAAWSGL